MKPRKMNLGGTQSWPPDTEDLTQVARQDNTYVTAPQLNFLANQLLPAQVPITSPSIRAATSLPAVPTQPGRPSDEYVRRSNALGIERSINEQYPEIASQVEMLSRQGIPDMSTQPRPSAEYVRTSNIIGINRSNNQTNREIAALVEKGYSETTAKAMVDKYYQDMRDRNQFQPGTVKSVTPLIELTPIGDVLAMGAAVGQALQGDALGAGATGGLALASIFTPGTVPAHAQADDLLRLSASSLASRGVVDENVVDIIEYIQEVATPGNISFGRTRSSAVGGGERTWREPTIMTTSPIGNSGVDMRPRYIREAIDRPYSTGHAEGPRQTLQSGRSVGNAIATSGSRASDADIQATADLLEDFVARRGNMLDEYQQNYYEGIIQSMRENLQGGAQRGVGQPRPTSRPVSVQSGGRTRGTTPETIQQTTNNTAPVSGSIGKIGDQNVFSFTSYGEDAIPKEVGGYANVFVARGQMGSKVQASGTRNADGSVDYTFYLNGKDYEFGDQFKGRVRNLVNEGMSVDAAKQVARREFATSMDQALKKMYGEIPVGSNIAEYNYSTDSYPMFLHGLKSGKYKAIGTPDASGNVAPIQLQPLNTMGASNKLYRKFNSSDVPEKVMTKLEENRNWNNDVARIMRERYPKLDPVAAKKKAEKDALIDILTNYSSLNAMERYGIPFDDTATQDALLGSFKRHLDGVIDETNDSAIDALIRHELRTNTDLTPMQAEINVMNSFIPLPKTEIRNGVIRVPVPRAKKIRAEEGAFLSNFTVKKNKQKGMRIKKGA